MTATQTPQMDDYTQIVTTLQQSNEQLKSLLRDIDGKVDNLNKLMSGNGSPEKGYVVRIAMLEDFCRGLGMGGEEERKITSRIRKLENIVFPIIALATPIAIWAMIQIILFLSGTLFHTGGAPYVMPTPRP